MDAILLPSFDFDALNEADIREEVIAPVLRRLGYQSGTQNNVLRERHIELRYPHLFLGRKNARNDPILRGRPDYICEVREVTRWAIEAKPPTVEICRDDIEQAHSYSVHPELAAPLFVVSNGRDWQVYESNRGPASNPILRLSYDELRENFYALENLLSPGALRRHYPVRQIDFGRSLAPGFGSRATIVGGFTRFDEVESYIEGLPLGVSLPEVDAIKRLTGYRAAITDGRCFRDPELGIVADVNMHHPLEVMKRYMELIGLLNYRYVTRAEEISSDAAEPTIFELTIQCVLPANKPVVNMLTWSEAISPVPINLACYAEATGYLDGSTFRGTYTSRMLGEPTGLPIRIRHWVFMRGTYEVNLAPE